MTAGNETQLDSGMLSDSEFSQTMSLMQERVSKYASLNDQLVGIENRFLALRQRKLHRISVLVKALASQGVRGIHTGASILGKALKGDRSELHALMESRDPLIQAAHETEEARAAARQCQAEELILHLLDDIHAKRAAGWRVILVMAPYFYPDRLNDGYYQRVQHIDKLMGEGVLRIYASWIGADAFLRCHVVDQEHYELVYSHPQDDRLLLSVAKVVDRVYHHSIACANEIVTRCPSVSKIFDMHGAYPEELRMYGRHEQAALDEQQERLALESDSLIICVSQSMTDHLKAKYPTYRARFLLLPIFQQRALDVDFSACHRPLHNGKPIVVYSGGLQLWQQIDRMQDAMTTVDTQCAYRVYTPDPDGFLERWGTRSRPADLEVSSKTAAELALAYPSCHYGFLLREDTVVNHVACPTKLVEYLANGIIPILYSPKIGDMQALEMAYIPLEDFLVGKLPDETERCKMAAHNAAILRKLLDIYHDGTQRLMESLSIPS